MIFVDSNIPMYLVGADHPNKTEAARKLESIILAKERLVTDAEIQQEILHRFTAIRRRDAIQPAFDVLLGIVDEVFPIDQKDVSHAKELLLASEALSARDAIHVAVMRRYAVPRILSFDRGFDGVSGIMRI